MKLSERFINYIPKIKRKTEKEPFSIDVGHIRIYLLLVFLLFCGTLSWTIKSSAIHNSQLQKGIAENIIRFHVIANSDSDEDQALKLKVKDELVQKLSPILSNATSIDEARTILTRNLDFIQTTAEASIIRYGYRYPVRVTLEDCYFPLKVYGNCTFPPGIYEALRVRIGDAKGKNWWCVMFPPLCFVDESYSIVDDVTDQKLKHLLTEEEYDTLISQKKPIKVKFKLWEKLKDLLQ